MNSKHRGALSELIAITWLLKQGYEVFRNVSAHGITDLVAINNYEVLKVDAKTAVCYKPTGVWSCAAPSREQVLKGVRILMVDPDNEVVIGWREEYRGQIKKSNG